MRRPRVTPVHVRAEGGVATKPNDKCFRNSAPVPNRHSLVMEPRWPSL